MLFVMANQGKAFSKWPLVRIFDEILHGRLVIRSDEEGNIKSLGLVEIDEQERIFYIKQFIAADKESILSFVSFYLGFYGGYRVMLERRGKKKELKQVDRIIKYLTKD